MKRFVYYDLGIDEICIFPNHVFSAWIVEGEHGAKWITYYCPWEPGLISRQFTPHEWATIQTLRWEYQCGRFLEV